MTHRWKPCPERPELTALLERAVAAFDALTPEQKREHRDAQRRSWVQGELMFEHPKMTADEANALIDSGEIGG